MGTGTGMDRPATEGLGDAMNYDLQRMHREFADSVVNYMKTKELLQEPATCTCGRSHWEENAAREAIHLLLTEARWETLLCLGGYRIPRWRYLREGNEPRPTAPDVWIVPDE